MRWRHPVGEETTTWTAEDFSGAWEMVGRRRVVPTESKSRQTIAAVAGVAPVFVAAVIRLFVPRKTFCKDPWFCIR